MTRRKTTTKLYVTALVSAWVWALVLSVAGIYSIPSPPKKAGADEAYFFSPFGTVEVLRRDSEIARNAAVLDYRPASPQQIQQYLQQKPDYGFVMLLIIAGLIAPVGLIAANRWWRWLRKPEDAAKTDAEDNFWYKDIEKAKLQEMNAESQALPLARTGASTVMADAAPTLQDDASTREGSSSGPEGRLSQLERVFKKGLITQGEYDKKKAEILSEL